MGVRHEQEIIPPRSPRPHSPIPHSPSPPPAFSHRVPLTRLLRWGFRRYVAGGFPFGKGYLAKHFHAVRLLEPLPDLAATLAPPGRRAFFLNHPSWWDPLAAARLAWELAPHRVPVAPIDAEALERYPVVGRLGLFPVERGTAAGARAFLNGANAALGDPGADLWLTPEGRFTPPAADPAADPAAGPMRFEPGLGRLLARDDDLWAVPVAVRYEFWTERLPELLLAVGAPVRRGDVMRQGRAVPGDSSATGDAPGAAADCTRFLEARLAATLGDLAAAARDRDPGRFRTLGRGSAGVSAAYDAAARAAAALRGRRYHAEHGAG